MDPQASYNLSGDTVPFNLAEIWPFPMNGGATTTSFHNNNNATSSNRLASSMTMTMNLNRDHDPIGGGGLRRRRPEDNESAKGVSTSNDANAMNEGDNKRIKTGGSNDNHESKAGGEINSVKPAEETGKAAEPPKQDYIHVRARRGQATDNHSLAERARREKISERMKILQDLVPGCNKVTGKALVLDEIINYIQSLQHQVEFLSMKLEAVNSRVSPGIEGFPSKDFGQPPFDAFGSQSSREYHRDTSPEWLHMQIGGGFERT